MSHAPDNPFGCVVCWGPAALPGKFPDMGLHVCNLPERHPGVHQCKCGLRLEGLG